MCAICGVVHFEKDAPVAPELVANMTASMAHRGPDGQRIEFGPDYALGFRRLVVIDRSVAAMQPFSNNRGDVHALCNGEIYNHDFLRRLLQARGHRFRSSCDSEVAAHAYQEYGASFVDQLEGMFAIAVLDTRRRQLLLFRDRAGIKPLYYYIDHRGVRFASEIGSLLTDPTIPRQIDQLALNLYFIHHAVPSPHTIYKNIFKLDPGERICVDLDRAERGVRKSRYWQLRFEPDYRRSFDDFRDELDAWVTDAVRSHLQSDVPLGVFFSGGIDSSTVLAKMVRSASHRPRAVTIGFADTRDDERDIARLAASQWEVESHEAIVELDRLAMMPEIAQTWGEPFGDTSAIPSLVASRVATEQGLTVMLSGDGGDELFSGYLEHSHLGHLRSEHAGRGVRGRIKRSLPTLLRRALSLHPARAPEHRNAPPWFRIAMRRTTLFNRPGRRVLRADQLVPMEALVAAHSHLEPLTRGLRPVDAHFTAIFAQYLHNDILTKVDRATARYGLEARVPLLDRRVMELAARIPYEMKITPHRSKHIFLSAVEADLPRAVIDHPKRGFGLPWSMLDSDTWRQDLRRMRDKLPELDEVFDFSTESEWPGIAVWRVLSFSYWFERHLSC